MKQKRALCPINIMRRKLFWKIWNKTGVPCHYNIIEGLQKIIQKFWDKMRDPCRYYIMRGLQKILLRILDSFRFRVLILKWRVFSRPACSLTISYTMVQVLSFKPEQQKARRRDGWSPGGETDHPSDYRSFLSGVGNSGMRRQLEEYNDTCLTAPLHRRKPWAVRIPAGSELWQSFTKDDLHRAHRRGLW